MSAFGSGEGNCKKESDRLKLPPCTTGIFFFCSTIKIKKKMDIWKKNAVIILQSQMGPKDADGIANTVDPDLGLHRLPKPVCPKT